MTGILDGLGNLVPMIGNNQGELSGICTVHHLVDHRGEDKVHDHTVDNTIHILKKDTTCHDNDKVGQENQFSQRQMRMQALERHHHEVCTSGRGILHINECIADSHNNPCAEGSKQTIPVICREHRPDIVYEERRDNHTADRTEEKSLSQQLITQQCQRDVEHHDGCAQRKPKQTIENQGNTRKSGQRKFSIDRKTVQCNCNQNSAQCFHQKRDNPPFPFFLHCQTHAVSSFLSVFFPFSFLRKKSVCRSSI